MKLIIVAKFVVNLMRLIATHEARDSKGWYHVATKTDRRASVSCIYTVDWPTLFLVDEILAHVSFNINLKKKLGGRAHRPQIDQIARSQSPEAGQMGVQHDGYCNILDWTWFLPACTEVLISSTAKRCQSYCWRSAPVVSASRLCPWYLTLGMAGHLYSVSRSWWHGRSLGDPPDGRPSLSLRSAWDSRW